MGGFTITIDGPAGAGKSTVARALAERLGFVFVDTGALYRAVGLAARMRGIGYDDAAALERLVASISIEVRQSEGGQRMFLDGADVTGEIRTPESSMGASAVSAVPQVRAGLLGLQRRMAGEAGAVAEGRDTGTVVFPDAEVKFYLDASPEVRARRRCAELKARGVEADFKGVLADTVKRDRNDSTRSAAPLRCPEGAVRVDTGGLKPEEVASILERTVRAAMGSG
jgi:cytidylate kinase